MENFSLKKLLPMIKNFFCKRFEIWFKNFAGTLNDSFFLLFKHKF